MSKLEKEHREMMRKLNILWAERMLGQGIPSSDLLDDIFEDMMNGNTESLNRYIKQGGKPPGGNHGTAGEP